VERGETIMITRHGRPIARVVPEGEGQQNEAAKAIQRLRAFRRTMPAIPLAELLAARHDRHRF
jgi:antitoxin (DNA-binding transcriptional repressor) of toxin-antitoxin stability system